MLIAAGTETKRGPESGYLSAYVARGEARPACKRAFDDQLAVFTGKPPTG